MMAEERAARSVFGKLRDGESCHISEHANRSGPASGKMRTCGHSDLRIVEPVNCGRNLRTKSAERRVKCGSVTAKGTGSQGHSRRRGSSR